MTVTSRRTLLKGIGVGAAMAFVPMGTMTAAQAAQHGASATPQLPNDLQPTVRAYRNWSGAIVVDALWTVEPRNADDVVALSNWAFRNGWKLRPRGYAHTWCPITISGKESADAKVLLVDTRSGLDSLRIITGNSPQVVAGTGVSQERLLNELAQKGLGMTQHPAPGGITLGGLLAIGGHGTAVPATGEQKPNGHTFGSVSNLIMALEAIVFDPAQGEYVRRRFTRDEAGIGPLLVHVGRSFITEVTLRVGPEQFLRCESYMDVPLTELLAAPGSGGRTVSSYLDSAGRMEIICFPHTQHPWLKVWSVSPTKPAESKRVTGPFNYSFSDQLSPSTVDLITDITQGAEGLTPLLGAAQWTAVSAGLSSTQTYDLWGSAKDLLMYVRPETLRVTANGYAVLCQRSDIQQVLHDFAQKYKELNDAYAARLQYPMNGPLEIRVVGLDHAADVGVARPVAAVLSPTRPAADHPEWDCAVYFDVLTLPGTRNANAYFEQLEQWMFTHFSGNFARTRVEWSKGWAYSATDAWTNDEVMSRHIPESVSAGQPAGTRYADAVATLNAYDPYRIFCAPLHDKLMPGKAQPTP